MPLDRCTTISALATSGNVQDPSWISLICNRAADVRWNPSGLEAGGPSRAGPFLACMEANEKEDMDESDEARKTKRERKSCTWVAHKSLFAQTFVPLNMATFTSSVSLKLKPRPKDCTTADFPVSEVGQLDSSK